MLRSLLTYSPLLAQAAADAAEKSDNRIYWALLLMACAVVLGLVELFVPSGLVLGMVAAGCAIGGVVLMFQVDTTFGLIGAVVTLIGAMAMFGFALRLIPDTPFVRWMTLGGTSGGDDDEEGEAVATRKPEPISPCAEGDEGVATTDLRPVGTCTINGKRMDCLAGGYMISKGSKVRVVSVDGMQIKVRPID